MSINSTLPSISPYDKPYPRIKHNNYNHFSKSQESDTDILEISSKKQNEKIKDKIAKILNQFGHKPSGNTSNDLNCVLDIINTDGPTGLKNKRALMQDLEKISSESDKKNNSLTIAMFDMDNFKAVNELLGYNIGDLFIKIIGSEIKKVSDKYNKDAYRFGGEEFYILMPNEKKENAMEIAENIRTSINSNKEIDKYMWNAIFEGKRKISQLEEEQKPFINFKELLYEYNIREKDIKEASEDADLTELYKKAANAEQAVRKAFNCLCAEAYDRAATDEERNIISSNYKRQLMVKNPNQLCTKTYMSYLNTNFNNEGKIAQITKWIEELQAPKENDIIQKGFTVTGGLKTFTNMSLSPEEYIKQTGDVLQSGKNSKKGKIYT